MTRRCVLAAVVCAVCLGIAVDSPMARTAAPAVQAPAAPSTTAGADHAAPSAPSPPEAPITRYTLPPDRYEQARSLGRIRLWMTLLGFVWGIAALWFVLQTRLSAKYRSWAERVSARRVVQALIFTPPLIVTIDLLELPLGVFQNWIRRRFGLSIQGWGSWLWDWVKGELVSIVIATLVIWVLYAVIRRVRRRWWVYFWLASLPIGLAIFFVQPLVIDPLFNQFEPLAEKEPALTASLERLVARAGENIPPERMYWMGAGEKVTTLNAYVSGFGASKRIVVWDTTIKRMAAPQIVFVAGHEMGHYVLWHIPKLLAFGAAMLFAVFYAGHRTIDWLLARWGASWGVSGLDDWASLPALLMLLSVFFFCAAPLVSAVSRHYEHQADQYAIEVTHDLTPDFARACAHAFQALGDVNLDDPEPSPVAIFLYYDHPPVRDRVQFCLSYDPWSKGQRGELVP